MLFQSFPLNFFYREAPCELEIRERYDDPQIRKFEVVQGGISIILLSFAKGEWQMCVFDDLHPVVKQDTESFVSQELVDLLIQAIKVHYHFFAGEKIK